MIAAEPRSRDRRGPERSASEATTRWSRAEPCRGSWKRLFSSVALRYAVYLLLPRSSTSEEAMEYESTDYSNAFCVLRSTSGCWGDDKYFVEVYAYGP